MRRSSPEVNAGSMADIAFLLLIFFLVSTTIEKDSGIARQLPKETDHLPIHIEVKEKNVLSIIVNASDELLVNYDLMSITDLKERAVSFLDNGGYPSTADGYCDYCKGNRDITSSDRPQKAVISITPDREASYATYIEVQNEISSAYNELRNRESMERYGFLFTEVNKQVKEGSYQGDEEKVKEKLNSIRKLYPMLISEAETKKEMRL